MIHQHGTFLASLPLLSLCSGLDSSTIFADQFLAIIFDDLPPLHQSSLYSCNSFASLSYLELRFKKFLTAPCPPAPQETIITTTPITQPNFHVHLFA
ncbi:hypothetical protein BJ878DRAFT_175908 [Calycina marina]|uniref:Secreted protein n=1 Tax=Calycina marina TaxID=1763456 RepID=A0A9P7YYX4_9HELO|nr:hypothetical protein BJ878DRAFT_175908 [Calycina marina]